MSFLSEVYPPSPPSPPLILGLITFSSTLFLLAGIIPPVGGLQSAGRPGKSLNYPFALKLKPNHSSPGSVRLLASASLRLIVALNSVFFLLQLLQAVEMKWSNYIKIKGNVKMFRQVRKVLIFQTFIIYVLKIYV